MGLDVAKIGEKIPCRNQEIPERKQETVAKKRGCWEEVPWGHWPQASGMWGRLLCVHFLLYAVIPRGASVDFNYSLFHPVPLMTGVLACEGKGVWCVPI